MQAANDAKNIDDIREFTSPEMFAEIRMQMTERGDAAQQTDVVRLDAELLEVVTEGDRHIASVRFGGLIREEADGPALKRSTRSGISASRWLATRAGSWTHPR